NRQGYAPLVSSNLTASASHHSHACRCCAPFGRAYGKHPSPFTLPGKTAAIELSPFANRPA
ncbi:MAG TPA: hypothetical protein PLF79_04380, partial [Thauera sp.]|nr:hypothetical protein [Thauera sp.]